MMLPTVDIIIPSYNHRDYILETLMSCTNQTYKGKLNIILIDDCSTDGTPNLLSEVQKFSSEFRRIRVLYNIERKGVNSSIERGLQIGGSEFVQLLASDDLLVTNKIQDQVEFLTSYAYDCVYSRGYFLFADGSRREIFLDEFYRYFSESRTSEFVCTRDWGGPLTQSALFRRSILVTPTLREYRRSFRLDDWPMLIFLVTNCRFAFMNEPTFYYRMHAHNTSKDSSWTFPARIEVVARAVDYRYQDAAFANIFSSYAEQLVKDGKKRIAVRFFLSSLVFDISLTKLKFIGLLLTPKIRLFIKLLLSLLNRENKN